MSENTTIELEPNQPTFLFSSELRSLMIGDPTNRKIDQTGLSTYLWNGFVYGPNTLVKGMKRFDAGSYMLLNTKVGKYDYVRYWRLPNKKKDRTVVWRVKQ